MDKTFRKEHLFVKLEKDAALSVIESVKPRIEGKKYKHNEGCDTHFGATLEVLKNFFIESEF